MLTEMFPSKSEARRLVQQNGIAVNGEKFDDHIKAIQKIEEIGASYAISTFAEWKTVISVPIIIISVVFVLGYMQKFAPSLYNKIFE